MFKNIVWPWQYRKRALAAEAKAEALSRENMALREKINDSAPVFAALAVANQQVRQLTEQVRQMSDRR